MTLRQANEQEVLDIVSLEKECFGDAWSEKQIEGILSNSLYDVYVLRLDEIVGYFVTMTVDDCELLRICVCSKYRGKGYATVMMQKLIDEFNKTASERILLEVRHTNIPAIALYKKFGFVEFGVRKNYYGDGVDARLFAYYKGEKPNLL